MKKALLKAKEAFEKGEVPVGALLVDKNGVELALEHNLVESMKSGTAHAEILCIKAANEKFQDWRLCDTTLYVTLEPCLMCFGAILLSRVSRVVYGAKDIRHGACGSIIDAPNSNFEIHKVDILGGILKEESSLLLKTFFQNRRREKICEKREPSIF